MFLVLLLILACGLPWAIKEHRVANKYRALVKEANTHNTGTKWTLVYKEGKVQHTVTLDAAPNEPEALVLKRALATYNIRYDKFISLAKSS